MSSDMMLILDRRDMLVSLEGKALRVERPDGAMQRVPLGILGMVVVHGAPVVSCDVWRALAERCIPAVLVPARGTGVSAWLGAGLSTAIQIRCLQHRAATEVTASLTIARTMVTMKLQAQRRLIERFITPPAGQEQPRLPVAFDPHPPGISALLDSLDRKIEAVSGANDVPTLMGVEGTGAAAWYAWLAETLPGHWRFSGRNRRPPRDAVNAMLSLGYTLLFAEMQGAVQEAGLDPGLGFLHGIRSRRESLVLDLMEPLRPGVDAFVLQLLDSAIKPTHFNYSHRDGCRLTKEGRGIYYPCWAISRANWPIQIPLGTDTISRPDESPTDEGDTTGDSSLRIQCRRMIQILRGHLQAGGVEPIETGDLDG